MVEFRVSYVSTIFGTPFSENQSYVGKQMSTVFKDLHPEFPSHSLLIVLP
jgi:hypothetical protein